MPARFVIVHDDAEFTDALVEKLGKNVARFTDPVRALTALKSARTVAYLITRLQFTDYQPVGLSLARLAREARPDVRVVFTGAPQLVPYQPTLDTFRAKNPIKSSAER